MITKTETSLVTTTAYSTVTTTTTLVKKNSQLLTINSTFINLSLQYPIIAVWTPEGLNLTITIRFNSYYLLFKKLKTSQRIAISA